MLLAILVFWASIGQAQTVAPIQGLGSIQFLDNSGVPLINGVLYSYQAGTSIQQATYTDSSGTTQNPNPIPFGSGARATIWLASGQFYKLVLCLQNDGAFCSSSDILFSQDNVPGGSTSSGGGSSPFTGTFISGSASPATSGTLRLASGDQVCWRNASGSTNLCISKDSNDLLTWAGGSLKFPEIPCPGGTVSFDIICADNTAHRWKMANNGGTLFLIPGVATPGTSGHVVVFAANGIDLADSGAAPTTGVTQSAWTWGATQQQFSPSTALCPGITSDCMTTVFSLAHTIVRMTYTVTIAPSCSTNAVVGVRDTTSSTNLITSTISGTLGAFVDSGAVSIATTAGDTLTMGLLTAPTSCSSSPQIGNLTVIFQ